jgi:plastocyanin
MGLSRAWISRALIIAGASVAAIVPSDPAAARDVQVPMANMAFGSIPSGLKVGDTITWVNNDSVPHTVTARDHSFDLRIGPHQRAQLKLTKAGTYQIYCIIHAPMRGSFAVGA